MGLFGFAKKAAGTFAREAKAEYGQNKDFLEACCAAVALVAYADGELEDAEKTKAFKVIGAHATLSKLYNEQDIRTTMETMFKRADSHSGRAGLYRELDDIKGKGNPTMAEDVYLIGLDIAHADGELEAEEAEVLTRMASRMGVDLKALGLQE